MTPVSNSTLTSAGLWITGLIVGWLVSHNVIPAADVTTATAAISGFLVFLIGAAITWYKTRQVTQTAMIKSVNATSNGVVVVPAKDAAAAGIPPVSVPVTGPEAPKPK